MVDRLTRERRSWNMGRIRGTNTGPEIAVRRLLHRLGYRFRLHHRDLPGRPDIVLSKWKTVIFVHGCFWHRHKGCRFSYNPKSRIEFWTAKFANNVARDRRHTEELVAAGWTVITVWECEASAEEALGTSLLRLLKK